MKKFIATLVAFSFLLTGCSGGEDETFEVALVTDAGNINDKSFNQSAWEAVEQYAKETDTTYKYYKPATFDTAGYLSSIEEAVANGAKVVVTPGFKFNEAMYDAQDEFPEVNFIMIDAAPQKDGEVKVSDNVYSVGYKEEQPGYLAGYAAVKDGNTKLGFMGGIALPAVMNFGFGFAQGARDAAKELGVEIELKYRYTGSFVPTPEIKAEAATWYNEGTEVIFSCGGGICDSIFAAAQEAGAKSIGVDSDQKDASKTVITSAMKGVRNTVYDALVAYGKDAFPAGNNKTEILGADGGYVGLSDDFSRFESFDKDQYDEVLGKIKAGEVEIRNMNDHVDSEGNPHGDPTVFESESLKVSYFK